MAGIALGETLGIPEMDGAASILIGLILALVAAFLAYESKGLLIGESARKEVGGQNRGTPYLFSKPAVWMRVFEAPSGCRPPGIG